ncbi:MAG: aldehyde dehydrogenase family protein [Rhodoplanes sp.]|uniref:aldehyde dehydrogenase family protein n=1 Tax=Rhodoplanes sp. TaxID=1968906 RepID=UPI001853C8A2|nr:aldehyde dehydrogenase family protein [Rhodoplanes sp.]NVO15309.1 aldehyde dehydrogenase family protein [Rhodoplanes sp.]
MARTEITAEQKAELDGLFATARAGLKIIAGYDQARVDRLAQCVAWAAGNAQVFDRIGKMGVEESGIGDWAGRIGKRHKILGVLRDALRQKSVGLIEDNPAKGLARYAKPAGVIASLIPMTNPELTPIVTAIYALKARDVVIFSPHPNTKKTTNEVVRLMREALRAIGEPDLFLQCLPNPNLAQVDALMGMADLVMATGGPAMVRAAYGSGKPAFGVGAGNSTMIIDETADVAEAARNSRMSKTSDFGSGCSADGNLIIHAGLYDKMVAQLQSEGGYLASDAERALLEKAMWDENGARRISTVAQSPKRMAEIAGFSVPETAKFIMVKGTGIGKAHAFSKEKLTTVMALYKYDGDFEQALQMMEAIFEVGGKGHSCGIYSFDDDHIHRLALRAPVTRIMVRQPQSKANAGAFNNGMPMSSSLGCGTWGGNIVSDNVDLKYYMNNTWVARPIAEDKPPESELFGEFFDPSRNVL